MVRILDVAAKPHKMLLLLRPPVFLLSSHLPALIKLKNKPQSTHTHRLRRKLEF